MAKSLALQLLAAQDVGTEWIIALEEYEVLFPKTRNVHIALSARQSQVLKHLDKLCARLLLAKIKYPFTPDQRKGIETSARAGRQYVGEQQALIEDLRVYLQNDSLSSIFGGWRVPDRQPAHADALRIARGPDGQLAICRHGDIVFQSKTQVKE